MELLVDGVLIILALVALAAGARRGAIETAGAAIGVIGGLWLGIQLAPTVVGWLGGGVPGALPRALITAAVVLVIAGVCLWLCGAGARLVRRAITIVPAGRFVDAIAGGALGLATWAVAAWLIAGLVVSSGTLSLAQIAQSSQVVAALNRVAPVSTAQVFGAVDDAFAAAGLPEVFSGGEANVVAVSAPPASTPDAVTALSTSVVLVAAQKPSCGVASTGSGWPLTPTEIVTNAHVVAGSDSVTVTSPQTSRRLTATVVLFDPEIDVAVLRVDGLDATPLSVNDRLADSGDAVYAIGYPGGGALTITPGRVRSVVKAIGLDITNTTSVTREIYTVRTEIRAGDSGGPLLAEDGSVVGLVFARSTTDDQTGYALTARQLSFSFERATTATAAVGTGSCVAS